MLVQFKVGNYMSFKEPQTLSLVASNDHDLQRNTFPVPALRGTSLLKSVAIYGANASGKSNLLKAMAFMREFVRDSANARQQGDRIGVMPFRLDPMYAQQPSEFEIVFIHGEERYTYGFTVDSERVHEEWLTAARIGARTRSRLLFRRVPDMSVEWGSSWLGGGKSLEERVRPDALILSVAAQFNNPTAQPVFGWLKDNLDDVGAGGDPATWVTSLLSRKSEVFLDRLGGFMRMADLSIKSWAFESVPVAEMKGWDAAPDDLRRRILSLTSEWVTPKAVHLDSDGKEVMFDLLTDESDGTRQLYALAAQWLSALEFSQVCIKDELEASLHPLITRALLEMMHGTSTAPQVVFSTHECSLLDPELLRRDQIWFTEKDASGATQLYSLWDFRVRPDEDFRGRYLKGRYGAVPYIGEWNFEQSEAQATR